MESLELIFVSMRETLEEFTGIFKALNKSLRDTKQMVRGGSVLTAKHMQLQVGILPSIADCLDTLRTLFPVPLLHSVNCWWTSQTSQKMKGSNSKSQEYILCSSFCGAIKL